MIKKDNGIIAYAPADTDYFVNPVDGQAKANAVVTVMTNEKSDDANGINVDTNEIWLQMARKDNAFAIHYSLDGKEIKY